MARSNRQYDWFVCPDGDNEVNKAVAELLGQRSDECLCPDKLCNDGEKRNLWRCSRSEVAQLKRSLNHRGISLKIFVREGESGPIRSWETVDSPVLPSQIRAKLKAHQLKQRQPA